MTNNKIDFTVSVMMVSDHENMTVDVILDNRCKDLDSRHVVEALLEGATVISRKLGIEDSLPSRLSTVMARTVTEISCEPN